VRDRYVLQVLVVTLGFGVVLGLIAVVDAPRDWSQPTSAAMPVLQDGHGLAAQAGNAVSLQGSASPASTERLVGETRPRYVMSPRVIDFADKADSPAGDSSDESQGLPWQHCWKPDSADTKSCEDATHTKAGKLDHC